jgi:hypothetical protein
MSESWHNRVVVVWDNFIHSWTENLEAVANAKAVRTREVKAMAKPERMDEDSVELTPPAAPVAVFRHASPSEPEAAASASDPHATGEIAPVEVSVEIAQTAEDPPVARAARAIFRHKSPSASATDDPAAKESGRPVGGSGSGWPFPLAPGLPGANGGPLAFHFRMLDALRASLMINLEYAQRALRAASFSDLMELQSECFRRQVEVLLSQGKRSAP